MKKYALSILVVTTLFGQTCKEDFQWINGKKMMSNCRWKIHLQKQQDKIMSLNYTHFIKTIKAESLGKYDAVNFNDLNKVAYGFVQFRGTYAKLIERKLHFNRHTKVSIIKRKLRSKEGIKLQHRLFHKEFIEPTLKFAKRKRITNIKVIELLVDWKVNGMPKRYCKYINRNTTPQEVVNLRKGYYRHLRKKNPRRYTRKLYLAWLKRLERFM